MSTATSPGLRIAPIEQYECPQCDSVIPRANVVINLIPQNGYDPVRQSVQAYCEHCRRLYRLVRTLRGGTWQSDSQNGEVVTAPSEIDRFRKRLEIQRGDIHRNPAA